MDSPLAAVEAWSLDEMLEAPEVSISALLAKALRSPLQEAAKASGAVVVGGRRSVCVAEAPEGLLEKAFAEQLGEDAQCEERLAALLGTRDFSETLAHALAPALRALHESSPAALSRASVARVESAPPLSGKFIATAEEAQPTLRARLDVAGELGSLSLTSLKERLCALLELEPALVNVTAGEGEAEGTSDGEGEGDGPSAELCIEVTCVSPDTLLLSASATRLHALPPGPSSELGVTLVRSAEASVDLVVPALRFGEVSALFGGLAAIIGKRPEVPLLQAMKQEHHGAADSREPFTTGNYSISTTSAIEHTFVVAPQEGPRLMESARPLLLGEAAPPGAGPDEQDSWWPHEPALRDDPTRRSHCRVPRPMEEFAEARAEVDTHLAAVGVPPIRDDEFIALRLYTGPMFEKYCAVLRGVPPGSAFLTGKFQKLCLGNTYPATIYALGDALSKLSKISRAEKVYRGVAGLRLPDEFLTRDEFGVRGGVEFGFLSATTDRSVALAYAASGSSTGVVYEIQQTMGSRGADISWCSQYPFEKEVCFAPLLGLEVQEGAGGAPAKRIEGGVVVVELLASVSHGSTEEEMSPDAVTRARPSFLAKHLLPCIRRVFPMKSLAAAEAAASNAEQDAAASMKRVEDEEARAQARAQHLKVQLLAQDNESVEHHATIQGLRLDLAHALAHNAKLTEEDLARAEAWLSSKALAACEASGDATSPSEVPDEAESWCIEQLIDGREVNIKGILSHMLRRRLQWAAKGCDAVWSSSLEKAFAMHLGEHAQCEERLAAYLHEEGLGQVMAHALAPALRALHESSPAALSRASVARVESAPPLSGKFIATAEEAQPTLRARLDVAGELGSLSLTSLKERLCALLELEPALVNVTAGEGEAEGTSDGEGEGDGPSAELCIEVTCVSPDTLLLSASATRLHALPPGLSSELGVTLVRSAEASVDLVVPALRFGEVSALFGGLAAIIGKRPEVPLLQAMKQEHHGAADSREPFTTGNYSISTTSAIEHTFVVAPQEGPRLMESARPLLLGEAAPSGAGPDEQDSWWPHEPALRDDPTRRSHCRVPRPMEEFAEARAEVDTHLAAVGVPPIRDDEFIALRLYTGPMFEKYCAVLRGVPPGSAFLTGKFQKLCLGNTYPATIYALGDALSKLSKISRAEKVYRGVAGLRLPDEFLTRDEFGVRGGVEFGFLSATTDRSVALAYAASGSSTGVVYEIQQTMGSRGADISWCSQYPFEKEVCFAPLLGLEVQEGAGGAPAKRIEGGVVVVELLASVSHGSTEEAPPPELQPLPDSAPSGHLSSRKSKGASIAPTASVSAAEDDDDGQADGANVDDGPRLSTYAHTQSL